MRSLFLALVVLLPAGSAWAWVAEPVATPPSAAGDEKKKDDGEGKKKKKGGDEGEEKEEELRAIQLLRSGL